jgi:hypothetical protein
MSRGSALKPSEGTRVIRIRAPQNVLRKLERFTPAQVGAWVYHLDQYAQEHAPELSLEHSPAPIPEAVASEKPINPRLAELLKTAKPVTKQGLQAMKNALEFTKEELEADERFWRERAEERQLERALMMRELEDEAL